MKQNESRFTKSGHDDSYVEYDLYNKDKCLKRIKSKRKNKKFKKSY